MTAWSAGQCLDDVFLMIGHLTCLQQKSLIKLTSANEGGVGHQNKDIIYIYIIHIYIYIYIHQNNIHTYIYIHWDIGWQPYMFSRGTSSWNQQKRSKICHDEDAQKNCPNNIARRYLHVYPQNPPKQWFPSKHSNLHICRNKTVPKHRVLKCFQFPYLPKPLKIPLFKLFSSIFHVPMPLANSNIYTRNPSETFFHCVFTKFPVKNTVI